MEEKKQMTENIRKVNCNLPKNTGPTIRIIMNKLTEKTNCCLQYTV